MQHLRSSLLRERDVSTPVHCASSPGKVLRLATVLPRRIAYRVSYGTAGLGTCYTKQSSFRARTTRVSNPVCSPSFRASASVVVQCAAFATGVPPDIYAFHRYTGNSTHLSHTPARQFRLQAPS